MYSLLFIVWLSFAVVWLLFAGSRTVRESRKLFQISPFYIYQGDLGSDICFAGSRTLSSRSRMIIIIMHYYYALLLLLLVPGAVSDAQFIIASNRACAQSPC